MGTLNRNLHWSSHSSHATLSNRKNDQELSGSADRGVRGQDTHCCYDDGMDCKIAEADAREEERR
jgi:hypothetical protein